ncbi:MAG TPA: O-acetyl-ADP-ribose deacetylase [Pyrinomonadaceae bacterium]|nr:O-acetyl-ADP-ribose deacetylase [Pyrinomonadaceae bacterium]
MPEETSPSFLHDRVRVVVDDITRQQVDAVVNAANSTLLGGGGVDGAIHRAGGATILEECQRLRRTRYPKGLPTGEAAVTTGGLLPARYVIHTVGPVWGRHEGKEAELLAACYRNSLSLALEHGLNSVAFPSVSTGAYSYPRSEAAAVSSQAIKDFLAGDELLREVRLVFFSTGDAQAFLKHQKFN